MTDSLKLQAPPGLRQAEVILRLKELRAVNVVPKLPDEVMVVHLQGKEVAHQKRIPADADRKMVGNPSCKHRADF